VSPVARPPPCIAHRLAWLASNRSHDDRVLIAKNRGEFARRMQDSWSPFEAILDRRDPRLCCVAFDT
jgi:hypothetical protein